eukprot:m51a1_g12754 hypothetical protein (302) ;mRNA; f:946-2256
MEQCLLGTVWDLSEPCRVVAYNERTEWMARAPGLHARTLAQVPLPGTHDSCTSNLSSEMVSAPGGIPSWLRRVASVASGTPGVHVASFIRSWAQTQRYGLYDQLMLGVRLLDLRVVWDQQSGAIRAHHMLMSCSEVGNFLDDVAEFLTLHEREVVVLWVSSFAGFSDEAHRYLLKRLGHLLVSARVGFGATLGEMWAARQRALVFYCSPWASAEPSVVGCSAFESKWFDSADPGLILSHAEGYAQAAAANSTAYKFPQLVLTPHTLDILWSLGDWGHPRNLHEFVAPLNERVSSFLEGRRY